MSDLVVDLSSGARGVQRLADRLPRAAEVVHLDELRGRGAWSVLRRLRRGSHGRCVVLVDELRIPTRWLAMVTLALLPRARQRSIMDREGAERAVSWGMLVSQELPFVLRRARVTFAVARRTRRALRSLEPSTGARGPLAPQRIAVIRPDLGPALEAGGSLTHVRGVISGFERHGCATLLLTPAPLAGFDPGTPACVVVPADESYGLSVELPHLAYNETLVPFAVPYLRNAGVDLVYQRHALGCYAGAAVARALRVPLVVEYNGPEVWIARNWGAARKHLGLFEHIERRLLNAADLVVAVSEPLRDPLRRAGVAAERILINPNGVDAERFDPERLRDHREEIRARLGVGPEGVLAGFVGTFGPWHGAEILAHAIGRAPLPAQKLRFVFIGDGERRAQCEAILERARARDRVTFTGQVAPDEVPGWLAACDICVSPHVPNPDGSPFFGSPTKLFEYLASGRAVLASRLGQIAEVLEHGHNAWLVAPGDADALASGLSLLAADPELRRRLGEAGRRDAAARHSWTAHVERILDRLAGPTARSAAR